MTVRAEAGGMAGAASAAHASMGVRVVAAIIDIVITMVLAYLIAMMTGQTTEEGFELEGLPMVVAMVIGFGYFIVLEARGGATVGKMALKLRVVDAASGAPISWQASIVRNVLRIVDGLPAFYLLGAIVAWMSPRRQRIGDRVAGTVVVAKG